MKLILTRNVLPKPETLIYPVGKKALKKRTESLSARIREHEYKIHNEKKKTHPDYGLIRHWETETAAFLTGIERAEKRLQS